MILEGEINTMKINEAAVKERTTKTMSEKA